MAASVKTQTSRQYDGGLSHLVEAATALTELVDSSQAPITVLSSPVVSEQGAKALVSDDDEQRQLKPSTKIKKKEIFPQRLMEILSDPSLSEIISWLPHGRSFVIIRPDIFTEEVLPKYMPPVDSRASTKYPSFTRKLNRWGFRQATRGPDTGAFHHSLFRRDQPDLCLQMACQKSKERQGSQRRCLPPKKRAVSERTPSGDTPKIEGAPSSVGFLGNRQAASISADERSVASFPNSISSSFSGSHESSTNPPNSIVSAVSDEIVVMPFISNDSTLVAKTLRERDSIEVVRAAKAMLYDSYMRALKGEGF